MSADRPGSPAPAPTPSTSARAPAPLRNKRFVGQAGLAEVLAGRSTLGPGARGTAVRAVQQALIDMGFSLPGGADGAFGGQSAKALRNFQVHARSAFPEVQRTGVVGSATLRALDALAPAPKKLGQLQHLPVPRYEGTSVRVVVVKDEHRTFLFDTQGQVQAIYGNAVGARSTPTDKGLKKVTGKLGKAEAEALGRKLWGAPVYGPRLIDLSWADGSRSGEELHGTHAATSLGEDVSHGCIRHGNADILALYEALQLGDWVAVVDTVKDPRLGPEGSAPGSSPDRPAAVASRGGSAGGGTPG
ncbi:MAG: murein L,D-transpeptidase [Myxococcaceae bacterium]|nr:murein L,D-transpeptidase [Myxococcaceae bacterium]